MFSWTNRILFYKIDKWPTQLLFLLPIQLLKVFSMEENFRSPYFSLIWVIIS